MSKKHYFMGKGAPPRGVDPDNDTNSVTTGVSKTGAVAPTGTVTQTEHWNGSMDANVRPRPVSAKLSLKQGG